MSDLKAPICREKGFIAPDFFDFEFPRWMINESPQEGGMYSFVFSLTILGYRKNAQPLKEPSVRARPVEPQTISFTAISEFPGARPSLARPGLKPADRLFNLIGLPSCTGSCFTRP
jgi:hypothetical protein